MRVTKKHDVRQSEILDAAETLFMQKGYESTTINDILEKVEIGKGTFYHYYKSKEEVMNAVIDRMVERVVAGAKGVAEANMSAHKKMTHILSALNISDTPSAPMIEELHMPSNALMHQQSIMKTIKSVAPIIAGVVRQGISEGVYHTKYPQEAIEFLLAANQLIFDSGIFQWTWEEIASRAVAFVRIVELVLGAEEGSFGFILELLAKQEEQGDHDGK